MAAPRVGVVTVDAASLGGPLGVVLVPALGPAGRPPGPLSAAVAAWVHAVDAASLLAAKDGVALVLDGLALVVGVAGRVGVVAVDTAALADPAELDVVSR